MNHVAVFTLTPANLIAVDRRILNQCRVFTDRGWRVTLILPGEGHETGRELWSHCSLKTFSDADCSDIGYLYNLLRTRPTGSVIDEQEIQRLRTLIDTLPAPRTAGLFDNRENRGSSREFASDDNIFGPYSITGGCISAVHGMHVDAVLAADYQGVVAARILQSEVGIPYLFDSHEFAMGQLKKSLTCMKLIKRVENECIRNAFCFYTISDFFADLFRYEHGLAHRPPYVFNAPDFGKCRQLDDSIILRTFGLPQHARTVLFHGGLQVNTRNIERMLRVAPQLRSENIHFVFLGYGQMDEAIVKAGENVHFHPAVDQASLASWVHSATACIVPYIGVGINHRFCTPNRFFDGMEVGTPVIVNSSHEYTSQIVDRYGVGYSGPMETDREMVSTLRAALHRFETDPADDQAWTKVRLRFSFRTQRDELHRIVERLELYLSLRGMDEMTRLETYARLSCGDPVTVPRSLLAENLIRFAADELDCDRSEAAQHALSRAGDVEPEFPGLDRIVSSGHLLGELSEGAERVRELISSPNNPDGETANGLRPLSADALPSVAEQRPSADTQSLSDAQSLIREGESLLSQAKHTEALRVFETVLRSAPDNATALHHAGLACAGLGRIQDAVTYFEGTLSVDSGNASAFFNLIGQCLRRNGVTDGRTAYVRFEAAISDCEEKETCRTALFADASGNQPTSSAE